MRIDDVGGRNMTRPAPKPIASPSPTPTPSATPSGSSIIQQATPKGATRPDVQQLAVTARVASAVNPAAAPIINAQIAAALTPVEYGQYLRAADALEKKPNRHDIDGDGKVSFAEAIASVKADVLKAQGVDVPIRHLHLNDPDYEGIPQGQGYDKKTNEFLTTYYAKDSEGNGTDVRLSIQDKRTGYETAYVKLKDEHGGELGHGGGVAVSGKWVLVSDGNKVYSYDRAQIEKAKPGDKIEPSKVTETEIGSFISVSPDGKYAYVGKFAEDVPGKEGNMPQNGFMYRFEINQKTGKLTDRTGPQFIPDNAQGAAVTDKGIIFTTSFSNNEDWSPKELHFLKFEGDPSKGFSLEDPSSKSIIGEIDYYAEGINVIGNDLYITYESGAEHYDGKDGHQSIQKYSLDAFF